MKQTRIRVVETYDRVWYYPEYKGWFFWNNIDPEGTMYCSSLEETKTEIDRFLFNMKETYIKYF